VNFNGRKNEIEKNMDMASNIKKIKRDEKVK